MMPPFFQDDDAPVQPDQFADEFTELLNTYRALAPMTVLEIGSREGGTLYQWIANAPKGAHIISLDWPGSRPWGTQQPVAHERWGDWAAAHGVKLTTVFGDSHDDESLERVKAAADGIDFLFIDGDHTEQGVLQDLIDYTPLVADGGIIALHDILPDASDERIGVYRVWRRIKAENAHSEFISHPQQESRGIGVIYQPERLTDG